MYFNGDGSVLSNFPKAAYWFQKASKQGIATPEGIKELLSNYRVK